MKTVFKTVAIAIVALGVSGTMNTASTAYAASEVRELRDSLRVAITDLIIEAELAGDAIEEQLQNDDLSRDEERALLAELRILRTESRRLVVRRRAVDRWNRNQLNFWAGVFLPTPVSRV